MKAPPPPMDPSIIIVSATLSQRALTILDELRQELERLNPGRIVRFACASCGTKEADRG